MPTRAASSSSDKASATTCARRAAVNCDPEQVVVTAGTQQAIDIAIRVLLAPGDEVWVEDPGYPLTHAQLLLAKTRPHPVPVDAQGLVVEAGLRAAPRARAVFVTPSHQFPIGVALSMARRLELLAWARESGAYIVEDDYTSEFRYSGPPLASLQGLDESEQVIYVGTLNKALFPGLRIGYVVTPPALLQSFVGARYLMDRQPPTLHQAVVAEFMQEGHFAAHIRRMRQLYRAQRDALASTLTRRTDRLEVAVPEQGMHLVAYLQGRHLRHRGRSRGAARRNRGARDQPLLPSGAPASRPDARLQRISVPADRAGGRASRRDPATIVGWANRLARHLIFGDALQAICPRGTTRVPTAWAKSTHGLRAHFLPAPDFAHPTAVLSSRRPGARPRALLAPTRQAHRARRAAAPARARRRGRCWTLSSRS